uniref:Acyl-coenzyme A oxidase n=1 Tax=Cavenderia deminutiva TaxID=361123 RepID=A0A1L2FV12_9MYCE|nr:putative acyl-CoA oxidase [Cavenderia deminutiva]
METTESIMAMSRLQTLANHLIVNETAAATTNASTVSKDNNGKEQQQSSSSSSSYQASVLGNNPLLRVNVIDQPKIDKLVDLMLGSPSEEVLATRTKLFEILKDPIFRPQLYASIPEQRELTLQRLKVIAKSRLLKVDEVVNKYRRFCIFQESLVYCDMSLAVKSSVQWGLFGGSFVCLGTDRHKKYYEGIDTLETLGCFALTELGHGSNVKGVETKAEYDHDRKEVCNLIMIIRHFIITTPSNSAQKIWIGNAALHGTMATVFANLYVKGENHGLHPFIVPIRDKRTNEMLPGVRAADCGPKMGLNGVDNGRLWFDGVRIPHENLLNKFGDVDMETGNYTTPIANPNVRFNSMLEALIGGRVAVSSMALNAAKMGLTIALRYAYQRRQFGAPNEELLIDYLSHQRRLFPLLAATYAYQISINYVIGRFQNRDEKDARDVFLLACGFKAACTWHRARTLQTCREACGGMGFGASNTIGLLRTDADVDLTYEGDNTVLMQAVAKALLVEFKSYFTGAKRLTGMLSYTYSKGHIGIFLRNQNFFTKRLHTDSHLFDAEMLLDAFIYREFKLLRLLVKSLRTKVSQEKMSGAKAWNSSLDLVMHLATAYAERVTMEKFLEAIANADESIRPREIIYIWIVLLTNILYKLIITEDLGWFLSNKYFAPVKAKAIQNAINKVCGVLRDHALPLIKAFDIPEHLVTAPIANDYVAHFSDPSKY